MKRIQITVEDEQYQELEGAKDGRTWREAIIEELTND